MMPGSEAAPVLPAEPLLSAEVAAADILKRSGFGRDLLHEIPELDGEMECVAMEILLEIMHRLRSVPGVIKGQSAEREIPTLGGAVEPFEPVSSDHAQRSRCQLAAELHEPVERAAIETVETDAAERLLGAEALFQVLACWKSIEAVLDHSNDFVLDGGKLARRQEIGNGDHAFAAQFLDPAPVARQGGMKRPAHPVECIEEHDARNMQS